MKKSLLATFTAFLCSVIVSAGMAIKSQDDFEKLRMKSGWIGEYKPMPKSLSRFGRKENISHTGSRRFKTILTNLPSADKAFIS
jgi:hypothetical protein